MQDASTIVAKFHGPPNEWVVHFEGNPGYAFRSENPAKAVRELLECTDAASGVFMLLSVAGGEAL